MTGGERLVWAAAYATRYTELMRDCRVLRFSVRMHAVEFAWTAVLNMRESVRAVREEWGDDSQQLKMLEEMLYDGAPAADQRTLECRNILDKKLHERPPKE